MFLIVPDFVGYLELQKDVLDQHSNCQIEIAIIFAVFGEKVDDIVNDVEEAGKLKQVAGLFLELFFTLTQLGTNHTLVSELHSILFLVSLIPDSSESVFNLFEQQR